MKTKVLIVEDEKQMLDSMKQYLEQEGIQVQTAMDGLEAMHIAQTANPDVVVLDWMLPGKSGIEVCRELRQTVNCGIIMVTAKSEESDKIIGLELGADDYMTKPFSLRELTSRIHAVLRRVQTKHDENDVMQRGNLIIDQARYLVTREGEIITLTPTEFKLLIALASRPGVVYSRLQLMRAAMGEELINYERTLDSHISKLRKKLEPDPGNPQYIQTVYGFGYRFGDAL
ncbi:response regulator transcription factor [Paenibacillus nasutitermitis]|uniref:DNA-binding response regulator n=1 Tax=Paenibacillus nasutitermitis TaxID=1652958 RepID=A0A917E0M1_9BACL|nr:response regulator transcription factor [Paenibacillus nasutitermitis]GGD85909.1 DNA-binding response regulator [Paenibacillus nasutitermitis]